MPFGTITRPGVRARAGMRLPIRGSQALAGGRSRRTRWPCRWTGASPSRCARCAGCDQVARSCCHATGRRFLDSTEEGEERPSGNDGWLGSIRACLSHPELKAWNRAGKQAFGCRQSAQMSRVWVIGEVVPTVRAGASSVRAVAPEVRGQPRAAPEIGPEIPASASDAAAEGSVEVAGVPEGREMAPNVGAQGPSPRAAASRDA